MLEVQEKLKSHALEENTHSHPTVVEAVLAAVAVVEKATCVGLETLVTSCCCWLELEACRLRAPWKEVPLWNALTTSICKESDSVTGQKPRGNKTQNSQRREKREKMKKKHQKP